MVFFRRWVTIVFVFCSIFSYAKHNGNQILFLNGDSVLRYPNFINHGWKYMQGDDSSWSSPDIDDSNWKEINPSLYFSREEAEKFKGLIWFRIHFSVDTSLSGKPLAMSLEHSGASQIWIDGKLLNSFGKINGQLTENYDPLQTPFIFIAPATGEHVLAVRYANFNTAKNMEVHRHFMSGFLMMIGDVDTMIFHRHLKDVLDSVVMLLSGIFIALCLLHFFMFLYQRNDKSNLYFSLFMLSLTLGFVAVFLSSVYHSPSLQFAILYPVNAVFCLGCISFSGFINDLFARHKTRFYVIGLFALITMVLRFLNIPIFGKFTVALIVGVSLEGVIMIIHAMYKRVEGSRIIGAGLLFFALFVLTLMTFFIVQWDKFDLDDRTTEGRLFALFFVLTILSIPLSMSIYQSWRFAKMNRNLALQLEQVKILSKKTLEQEREKQLLLENRKQELEEEVQQRTSDLRAEKKKSDDLLLNILPAETAEELKSTGRSQAKRFEVVTVMFTDFKNFTQASEKLSAEELVHEINACYSAFDNIITSYGIEKIKTIGDSYMCAGGLPVPGATRPEDVVNAGMEMQQYIERTKEERLKKGLPYFELRIGIHTGPVVAGIVGIKKFAYDIWGDTVNIASRMESSGETGKINISGTTYNLVKDKFNCIHRGKIQAKNKGEIDMYFVEGEIGL